MTFVEASAAPGRKNGQIKLHDEAAFVGMRKAGQLTAQALDLLVDHVRPGRYHGHPSTHWSSISR